MWWKNRVNCPARAAWDVNTATRGSTRRQRHQEDGEDEACD
ncbi:hypothetical protein M8C21_025676 [Ambrosia artemisiifolia]|uniref:Uncharacterized protein n=1 Tax=Ambrosia artemisiifolia TaxID=4212 RepID=A0AAD5CYQ3_AMBAR|nr:hypothetical protein M8C21_025676 [Ambrosia artemisiifolia]